VAALTIFNRRADAYRTRHSGWHLSSNGNDSPLRILPDSDGTGRRELDFSGLRALGIAQRAIQNSARGRISALMMVLSQGAMALGGAAWGLSAEIWGTRLTLLAAAFLFIVTTILSTFFLRFSQRASMRHESFHGIDALTSTMTTNFARDVE